MRYGFWLPVFGGWLRNVDDEGMEASWSYAKRLARRAEEIGFELTLVAELNLNDIKGEEAPSLEAWSTAAALAATTEKLEIMVAVRPTFHEPALLAKQAANVDHISGGRLSLNVVSAWWATEARKYGIGFDAHDDRYARSEEWLSVVDRAWSEPSFSHQGRFYRTEATVVEPKPVGSPRPTVWAGGESEAGKDFIARTCDGWLTHGDPPDVLGPKLAAMAERRAATGQGPLHYGVAGFTVVRDSEEEARAEVARITDVKQSARGYANYRDWIENTQLERRVSVEDYSVSNRGLRTGLVGTPERVAERIRELEAAGVDLVLLQCSPQLEEMERFAEQVMPLV
jgi:FMNH2-dependent dimethyl sulfone monooxygenase